MAWEMDSPISIRKAALSSHRLGKASLVMLLAALVCGPGCRSSQQTSIPNPFLSADRVPPPPSRIPAAGTAQPYYPGNTIPQVPNGVPHAAHPGASLSPSDDITPIPPDAAFTARQSTPVPPHVINPGSSAEAVVRVPSDDESVRFAALPTTTADPLASQPATPIASQPTVAASQQAGTAPTPTVFREPQSPPNTAPLVTNWPPVAAPSPEVTLNPVSSDPAASELFRNPQVTPQAPSLIQQPIPAQQQTTTPRIRVPGAEQRVREDVIPGSIHTTSYQVGMAGGGVQTTVIPPSGYAPPTLAPAPPTAVPNATDGFRPRGSARPPFGDSTSESATPTLRVMPG